MFPSNTELDALVAGPTPADPDRAPLGPCGFIEATDAAPGLPVGHGFSPQNALDCTGFYVYDPIPGAGLRILSLDLGPTEGGDRGILAPPYEDGAPLADKVGDPRYDQVAFVDAELTRAATEGVAVIVISHQASGSVAVRSRLHDFANLLGPWPELHALVMLWSPIPPVALDSAALRKKLASSRNVIAHIAGHSHSNGVLAICPDGTARADEEEACAPGPNGETGYWEFTTASGIDFPHQGRFVEIVHIGGTLAAFYLTMLEPRIPAGSFSERARFVATAWEELKDGGGARIGSVWDRNLLLPFVVPEAVATRWSAEGEEDLESETSLLESKPALPSLPVWPAP